MIKFQNKILWLVMLSMVILLSGCSSRGKGETKESLLEFKADVVAAGEALPHQYSGKNPNYSIRYSDNWEKPYVSDRGTATWKALHPENPKVDSLFNLRVINESDPKLKEKSAEDFGKMVGALKLKNISDLKITGTVKKETSGGVWFAVEYEGKYKKDFRMYFQQYYFDNGKNLAVLTGVFGSEKERTKYGNDLQATVSSLKIAD